MRVVVLEDYLNYAATSACIEPLKRLGEVICCTEPAQSEDENIARMAGADFVIPVRKRVRFTDSLLSRIRHVKLISQTGPWLSHIDLAAAKKYGFAISRCPDDGDDVVKTGTAEQTWNLILALMRDTELNQQTMRAGGWQIKAGRGLAGKTLGILGPGKIGSRVARVGLAFDMRVIGWSRSLNAAAASAIGIEAVSLDELLTQSDVISIHTPLTDTTRGFIGAREFALMKPTAVVVISSRGGVLDEPALASMSMPKSRCPRIIRSVRCPTSSCSRIWAAIPKKVTAGNSFRRWRTSSPSSRAGPSGWRGIKTSSGRGSGSGRRLI